MQDYLIALAAEPISPINFEDLPLGVPVRVAVEYPRIKYINYRSDTPSAPQVGYLRKSSDTGVEFSVDESLHYSVVGPSFGAPRKFYPIEAYPVVVARWALANIPDSTPPK